MSRLLDFKDVAVGLVCQVEVRLRAEKSVFEATRTTLATICVQDPLLSNTNVLRHKMTIGKCHFVLTLRLEVSAVNVS